ncbi:MAG TPA: class I SAM-dependent methyltransferase [Casimicrobiaceae bacterium]|nr:class I SAM-dependent methyltransferase [Casimicrobiaceae bacterium]
MAADAAPRREPTLRELYAAHQGKVSDKWSLYLDVYDRVLTRHRGSAWAMVEVGVQNGGSLELWARYFPTMTALVGCDVDAACGGLAFDDPRISIVVGDVNTHAAYRTICERAAPFDVFIDDGSHNSRDIIVAFCNYFRHLAPGGTYIVEDLHCSYYPDWDGGMGRRDTSMEFLKTVADFVNEMHWQPGDPAASERIAPFFPSGPQPDLAPFRDVCSVSFYDSLCVVEKRAVDVAPGLGGRFIVGTEAAVSREPLELRNQS